MASGKVTKGRAHRKVVQVWDRLLDLGKKAKRTFNRDAKELLSFFDGPHKEGVFDQKGSVDWDEGWVQMSVNKTHEMVAIIGPTLFWTHPQRTVLSRSKDPKKMALAQVLEIYLNYTPSETWPTLKACSRKAIVEGLIKGRGCIWTALDDETGLVASEYVSIDDILLDPDARDLPEVKWMARRRVEPAWLVAELFPDAADQIKSSVKSSAGQAVEGSSTDDPFLDLLKEPGDGDEDETDQKGETADLVVYYEIYSKMGLGFRSLEVVGEDWEKVQDDIDEKYIVIAEGVDKPLFVGDWPAPLFLDGQWFASFLDFIWKPNTLWSIPYGKPALGEQKAIDWLASFMITQAKHSSRRLVGVKRHLSEENKRRIEKGRDLEFIEIDSGDPSDGIKNLVDVLSMPPMSQDVPQALGMANEMYEQRTGMGELLYGQTRNQLRSAREADIKDRNSRQRIEDLARIVEDWQGEIARKEAILARFILEPEDVEKVVGSDELFGFAVEVGMGGQPIPGFLERFFPAFDTYFASMEEAAGAAQQITMMGAAQGIMAEPVPVTAGRVWADTAKVDAETIVREFSIQIEAASARRPDRNFQIDQVNQMFERVGMPALQVADLESYNTCLDFFYHALEIPKQYRVALKMPPPPPMAGPPTAGPGEPSEPVPPAMPGGPVPTGPDVGAPLPPLQALPGVEASVLPGAMGPMGGM